MKKLGIIARIDSLDKVPTGDKMNYVKFLIDYFRERRNLVAIDWRDINENLDVARHLSCNKEGIFLKEETINLNEICDLLFIKNLGKICKEQQGFLNFLGFLDKFDGRVTNPVGTIKNNLSKQYLLDLQAKGFPTVPTVEIDKNTTLQDLKKLDFSFNRFHKGKPSGFVVKPKVFGEQGIGVKKSDSFENEEEFKKYLDENGPVLVQPLISEIRGRGENSLIFFGKEFIHGVNKFTGKFKINCCEGILCSIHEPSGEELKLCEGIVDYWPDKTDYIRIDLIPYAGGSLISEVELVNPAFYIENILSLKDNFAEELENFFLRMED